MRHVEEHFPLDYAYKAFAKADEIIKNVAKKKNVLLIDAANLLVEKDEVLFYDHVHLEEEGSRQLGEIVKTKIAELIREKARDIE